MNPPDPSIQLERQHQLRQDAYELATALYEVVEHQLKLWNDPSHIDSPDPEPDNSISVDDLITLIETAMVLGHRAAGIPLDPSVFPARRARPRPTRAPRSKGVPYN